MRLVSFRVRKFRNVVDSGVVTAAPEVTCLLGRNEAGKSAILEALYLFNPAYGEESDVEEYYPRWLVVPDRKAGDLVAQEPIELTLELEPDDIGAVSSVFGVI